MIIMSFKKVIQRVKMCNLLKTDMVHHFFISKTLYADTIAIELKIMEFM